MTENIIKELGEKLIEISKNIKVEDINETILPLQMNLRINIRKITNDDIKISLFLLEGLIAKIMGNIVEKALFGGKRDDKSQEYCTFFNVNLEIIGKTFISGDKDKIFDAVKETIIKAGKEGLIKF